MLNIFTSFFSKNPGHAKHNPAEKAPFTIAGRQVYLLTNKEHRFNEMLEFFKQFDLKNAQTWETSQEELSSLITLEVHWKNTDHDHNIPDVRTMSKEVLDFYRTLFVKYKPDLYIIDQNLGSTLRTGQNISQCLFFAQEELSSDKTAHPPVVFFCSDEDNPRIVLHKELRYVMLSKERTINAVTPELYAEIFNLMQSKDRPTFVQKILEGIS